MQLTWTLIELHEAVIFFGCRAARSRVISYHRACSIVESSAWLVGGLRDLDAFKLLSQSVATIDLQQVLKLHALVHIQDSFVVALVERLLLRLLLHQGYLTVTLGQDFVGEVKFTL